MANISSLLGTAGGFRGTGVSSPDELSNSEQVNTSYRQNQDALAAQNSLLTQLQAQNGLGNQSQAYDQFQGIVNGTGPNPALAQLNQTTGQNIANQTAMMAGQRGASANPALIARQAAMQGGNQQQNAVGQAAILQAQQSLNALQHAGNIANTQVNNQMGQTNTNTQSQQNEQSNILNAMMGTNAQKNALINATAAQQASFGMAGMGGAGSAMGAMGGGSTAGGAAAGGAAAGGGSSMAALAVAEGGEIPSMESLQSDPNVKKVDINTGGPMSTIGRYFSSINTSPTVNSDSQDPFKMGQQIGTAVGTGIRNMYVDQSQQPSQMASGGKVPALLSPGERYLPPEKVDEVKKGANPMKEGQKVPGKPKVKGAKNDYANDTVKADLEEGGIVIPRSITQSKDAEKKSIAFVRALLARKK